MPEAVFVLVALIGAGIHVRRHKDRDRPAFAIDTFLVWWFVVPLGLYALSWQRGGDARPIEPAMRAG
jgi:uncharacterized membrane protein YhaH (DUF805 family)